MKFTRDNPGTLSVRSVSADSIRVGDRAYDRTIAMTAHSVIDGWPDKAVAELDEDDFAPLLDEQTEVLILGTGARNVFPPRELTFAMARRGIGIEVMDSMAAARTFNVLAAEGRRVAAVLSVLRCRQHSSIDPLWLGGSAADAILKGSRRALWGLLCRLSET